MKGYIIAVIVGLALGVGFTLIGIGNPDECPAEVVRIDTVKVEVPAPVKTEQVGTIKIKAVEGRVVKDHTPTPFNGSTSISAQRDTVIIKDTCFVELEIEEKTYKTPQYMVRVKGYQPELSYIETYNQTVIKKPRIALTIGGGAMYTQGQIKPGVSITAGFVLWSR